MGSDMKDEGGERIVHREDAGKKESDAGRGHYELVSPLFMERLAIWLEKGAKKYDPRNWEKGIPQGRIIRALLRHTYQYLEGMRDEDHLAAISCNIMFLVHFEIGIERGLYSAEDVTAMQNLPNYITKLKETIKEILTAEQTQAWGLLKDTPDQCIKLGCKSSKWLDEDHCLAHCNGDKTRAARLKDASDRYYEAKADMDAINKELKMEPLFICKTKDCERVITSDEYWCNEHRPKIECGYPGCEKESFENKGYCKTHLDLQAWPKCQVELCLNAAPEGTRFCNPCSERYSHLKEELESFER